MVLSTSDRGDLVQRMELEAERTKKNIDVNPERAARRNASHPRLSEQRDEVARMEVFGGAALQGWRSGF